MGGQGGTTSSTRIRTGAGSRMKLTWPYRPRTITHRAPGACSAAARASWVGTAVSISGAATMVVSSARASTVTDVTGENSGRSDSLLTSATMLAGPFLAMR